MFMASFKPVSQPFSVSHQSGMPSPSVSCAFSPLNQLHVVGTPMGSSFSLVMSLPLLPNESTSSTM